MASFTVKLFLVAGTLVASIAAKSLCPKSWGSIGHGDSCYHYTEKDSSYITASKKCAENNGVLANIETGEENDFLKSWVAKKFKYHASTEGVWISPRKGKDSYHWILPNNVALDFADWAPNEPNLDSYSSLDNHCAYMSRVDGNQWASQSCHISKNMAFICEYQN